MLELNENVKTVINVCGGITKSGLFSLGLDENEIKMLVEKKVLRKFPADVSGKRIAIYKYTPSYLKALRKNKFFTGNLPECSSTKLAKLSYLCVGKILNGATAFKSRDEYTRKNFIGLSPDFTFILNGVKSAAIVISSEIYPKIEELLKPFIESYDVREVYIIEKDIIT